jgi:hypothetical protein
MIVVVAGSIGFLIHQSGEHLLVVRIHGLGKTPNTSRSRWSYGGIESAVEPKDGGSGAVEGGEGWCGLYVGVERWRWRGYFQRSGGSGVNMVARAGKGTKCFFQLHLMSLLIPSCVGCGLRTLDETRLWGKIFGPGAP